MRPSALTANGTSEAVKTYAGPGVKPEEIAEAFLRGIPADEYPNLREMVVEYAMKAGHDASADFEFGLSLILDGLQRLLDPVTS